MRPDLVYGAAPVLARRALEVRGPRSGGRRREDASTRRSSSRRAARRARCSPACVSLYASRSPDGLNRSPATTGFADTAQDHAPGDGPLAGYATQGVDTRGSPAASPASSASPSSLVARRRAVRSCCAGAPPARPSDGTLTWARGTGTRLHFHGHSAGAPARRRTLKLARRCVASCSSSSPRRGTAYCAFAVLLARARRRSRSIAGAAARYLARRMVVEVPFLVFALLLPFVATGPGRGARACSLSASRARGGASALLVKGTLGVLASLTLAATTEPRDLLAGLERLRAARQLVQIMGFMVRYLDVVTGEMRPDADRP